MERLHVLGTGNAMVTRCYNTCFAMSALAAGLTVGGKACGKSFAIDSSTSVVRTAATVLHFFHTIPEKLRPKRRR